MLVWACVVVATTMGAMAVAISASAVPPPPKPRPVQIALRPLDFVPALRGSDTIPEASDTSAAVRDLLTEHRCLAEVMYYEARGEGEQGERAVAEVVFDRLAQGDHGKTLCSVVYEGAGHTFCQFTFACDGSMKKPKEAVAWRSAQVLAARLMVGELAQFKDVEGATHYHAAYVHPHWKLDVIARIGRHIFYR
jgi:spore germination cell wall hydrolase CwlJ-like protein